jgi:LacI family gluconate utilization system Gnt-I transcriptional repressor
VCCVGFSQTDAGRRSPATCWPRPKRRIAFAAAQLDPRVMQRL